MRAPLALALALLLGACEPTTSHPSEVIVEENPPAIFEETEPPGPDEAPPAIADGPMALAHPRSYDRMPTVTPAAHADGEFDSAAPVVARRYVYRARMVVPAGLGNDDAHLAAPAAELVIDVAHERLRARFLGTGWPIAGPAEVRMRRDRPGVYLFDGYGGRPLEPGELARWFEGGPVSRRGPPLRIFSSYGHPRHQAPPDDEEIPGELVCAFLAEWAGEPRENQLRRCELGAPYVWRIGFWSAEQTAGVSIEMTRAQLRGDESSPPEWPPRVNGAAFLEEEATARLSPRPPDGEIPEGAPRSGLRVQNESANRVIVTVEGLALGWVDAGETHDFVGLSEGMYEVGSMRPLGAVVQRGRLVRVPGIHRVCDGRCPRRADPDPHSE
ncbi:MAG: hypothetical protein AB7S26_38330 [Sandaracinaceae bacterium]